VDDLVRLWGFVQRDWVTILRRNETLTPHEDERDEYTCGAGLPVNDIVRRDAREHGTGITEQMVSCIQSSLHRSLDSRRKYVL
jgi:hypothetical protein